MWDKKKSKSFWNRKLIISDKKGIAIDDLIPLFVGVLTIVIILFILVAAGKLKDSEKQQQKVTYEHDDAARQAIVLSLRNETALGMRMAEFIAHLELPDQMVLLTLKDISMPPTIESFTILNEKSPCERYTTAEYDMFTKRVYLPSLIHGIANIDFCVQVPK